MNDFKALNAFVRVVELGSVSAAARDRGLSQPAMSRLIVGLERALGTRLLERGYDGMRVTPEGRVFYAGSRGLIEDFGQLTRTLKRQTEQAEGRLRVTASVAMCLLHGRRWVQEFLERHRGIEIDLDANDRRVDLVDGEFDVALRLGSSMPGDQIARKLGVSPRMLVASPDFLGRKGVPRQPADLSELPFVGWTTDFEASTLRLNGPAGAVEMQMAPRLQLSCGILVREAVCDGVGIGQLPLWIVADSLSEGRLVSLLPGRQCPPQDVYAVYPSRKYLPQRVKMFLDFVSERIQQAQGFEASARNTPGLPLDA